MDFVSPSHQPAGHLVGARPACHVRRREVLVQVDDSQGLLSLDYVSKHAEVIARLARPESHPAMAVAQLGGDAAEELFSVLLA